MQSYHDWRVPLFAGHKKTKRLEVSSLESLGDRASQQQQQQDEFLTALVREFSGSGSSNQDLSLCDVSASNQSGLSDFDMLSLASNDTEQSQIGTPTCRKCGLDFIDFDEQRAHFKSSLHVFNVKRSMAGMEAIDEEVFDELIENATNSEDSEDSEAEREVVEAAAAAAVGGDASGEEVVPRTSSSPRLLFTTPNGTRYAVWKCILGQAEVTDAASLSQTLNKLFVIGPSMTTVVLLCSGGHFAGVVYGGRKVVAKKTFHRYVVRKKQGARQSAHDGHSQPRSAGSSLRRYNEAQHQLEVHGLLSSWSDYLNAAAVILYSASGPSNRNILFGTQKNRSILDIQDPRAKSIPFPIHRPTLHEAERVFTQLTTAEKLPPMEESEPLQDAPQIVSKEARAAQATHTVERSDQWDLCQEEDPPPALFLAAQSGNVEQVKACLCESSSSEVLNLAVASRNAFTALHIAARSGHEDTIHTLLMAGADPTLKVLGGKTAYDLCSQKHTRDVFRRYMGAYPDAWDYTQAHIPSALTAEMEEEQERKREAKKEKEKQRKKEAQKKSKQKEQKRSESAKAREEAEAENHRLRTQCDPQTEREKRAKAAELRLLATGANKVTTGVCALASCGTDLAGKSPFECFDKKFCSTACIAEQRKLNSS